eukprot:TRINITY_DN930_c1_g2_i3.p2 TRINITY_DN930_c1_g2~~TRINITY_DN930_c1_g2_i3.p2  ORF type:complete len:130 (+),score=15.23 TRINITY_DN930_c1_g2_i3:360-749(+)
MGGFVTYVDSDSEDEVETYEKSAHSHDEHMRKCSDGCSPSSSSFELAATMRTESHRDLGAFMSASSSRVGMPYIERLPTLPISAPESSEGDVPCSEHAIQVACSSDVSQPDVPCEGASCAKRRRTEPAD